MNINFTTGRVYHFTDDIYTIELFCGDARVYIGHLTRIEAAVIAEKYGDKVVVG